MNYKKLGVLGALFLMFSMTLVMAAAPAGNTGDFVNTKLAPWTKYIIGEAPEKLLDYGTFQSWIVMFCLWLLLFVTFSDIIASFSTFSKAVSWISGFAIAIIAANIKLTATIGVFMIGPFAALGEIAIFAGLAMAFVVFILVNAGVWPVRKWLLKRRAMMVATDTSIGAKRAAGAIGGLGDVGKAFAKIK